MLKVFWSLHISRPLRKCFGENDNNNTTITKPSFIERILKGGCLLLVIYLLFALLLGHNNNTEYIVILSDGVTPEGQLPKHINLRIERANELWLASHEQAIVVAMSQGNPSQPFPLDKEGFPVYDATTIAKALIQRGIPGRFILEEAVSMDTEGNAFFLRTMHTDPAQIRKLRVITNNWHMPRTKAIFTKVFNLPYRADCFYGAMFDVLKIFVFWNKTWPYSITFETVEDGLPGSELVKKRQVESEQLIGKI